MRIAVSSAFWNNPSGDALGPWLDRVTDLGFAGVTLFADYWIWGDTVGDGRALRDTLRLRGLTLASLVTAVHLDFYRYRQLLDIMSAIGCRHLVLIGGTGKEEADRTALATVLNRIGRLARDAGITASYHHHTETTGETFAEVTDLLARTDPAVLHLAYDSGHAAHDFADLPERGRALVAMQRLWARVGLVELKDFSSETGLDTPLGAGIADIPALAAELTSRQYDDWVVIEQNPELPRTDNDRDRCARQSVQFLRLHMPASSLTGKSRL